MQGITFIELPHLWHEDLTANLAAFESKILDSTGWVVFEQPNFKGNDYLSNLRWRQELYLGMYTLTRLAEFIRQSSERFVYFGTGDLCPHFYSALARQCAFIFWDQSFSQVRLNHHLNLKEVVLSPNRLAFESFDLKSLCVYLNLFVQDNQPWKYPRIAEFGEGARRHDIQNWLNSYATFDQTSQGFAIEPSFEIEGLNKFEAELFDQVGEPADFEDSLSRRLEVLANDVAPGSSRTSLMCWYLAKKFLEKVRKPTADLQFSKPGYQASQKMWLINCNQGFISKEWLKKLILNGCRIHLVHQESTELVKYVEKVAILFAAQSKESKRDLTWSLGDPKHLQKALVFTANQNGSFEIVYQGLPLVKCLALGGLGWGSPDIGVEVIARQGLHSLPELQAEFNLLFGSCTWNHPLDWQAKSFVTPVYRGAMLFQMLKLCHTLPHSLKSVLAELELVGAHTLARAEVWDGFLVHQYRFIDELNLELEPLFSKDDLREFGKWKHIQKKASVKSQHNPPHSMFTHSVSYLSLYGHTLAEKIVRQMGGENEQRKKQLAEGLLALVLPHTKKDQLYEERLPNLIEQRQVLAKRLWPELR